MRSTPMLQAGRRWAGALLMAVALAAGTGLMAPAAQAAPPGAAVFGESCVI